MYIAVKPPFTPCRIDQFTDARDHPLMPRKVVSRLKPESRPRHFIKEWREYRNLTQEQLAERMNTSHATVSRIETGVVRYTQEKLELFAWALDCRPADLLMRDPTDPEGIWSIWDDLAPEHRAQIVEIARTFKKTG